MKCPKCGRENAAGAPFCADCGKALFPLKAASGNTEASSFQSTDQPAESVDDGTLILAIEQNALAPEAVDDADADELLSMISDGSIRLEPINNPTDGASPTPAPVSLSVAFEEHEPDPQPNHDPQWEPVSAPQAGSEQAAETAPRISASAIADKPEEEAPEAGVIQTDAVQSHAAQADATRTVEEQQPLPTAAPQPEEAVMPDAPSEAQSHPSTPAAAPEAGAAPQPEAQPEAAFTPSPQQQTAVSHEADASERPIIPPNPARPHRAPLQTGPEAQYQKGCLAAAWGDIMQTKGWFGKMLLLGLVGCVPILNFYVNGYAMRWSRELFLGKVAPMPERIFGNRMFVNGFFALVIGLLLSIVGGLCGALLGIIPIVGALCSIVIYLIICLFQYVALMRTAIADRLGAAFDISQIWHTCWKNLGALCCATIVPNLIFSVVVFVVVFALFMILGLPMIGSIMEIGYYGPESPQAINAVFSLLGMMVPFLIICYLIGSFLNVFLTMLTMRATGHYIARYAQEWKGEQAVMSTAYINGV